MPQGTVTAFYVWDNGQVDSYTVPAQTATLESLVEIGFLRQAELDYKEQRMQEILAELAQGVDEIVGAPE